MRILLEENIGLIRTYGTKKINKKFKYNARTETDEFRNKPHACLWASPLQCGYPWKQFCEENDCFVESLSRHCDFYLRRCTKTLQIQTVEDLKDTFTKFGYYGKYSKKHFDWTKIRQQYDAIYVNISNFNLDTQMSYNLTTWDVDSVAVFNLKKIVRV